MPISMIHRCAHAARSTTAREANPHGICPSIRISNERGALITSDRTSFGPYEIVALLGRGGVGEVYRAWDPRLRREVAVKILRERAEIDVDRARRFVAEARAASSLNHPNIVTVFDAAVDGITPYIVSELIDGESLAAEARRGPVPLKRILELATQIADGLAEAHAAGIVHRDLKPENIMITRNGRVKIVDFGLAEPGGFQAAGRASVAPESQTATEPGLLAGTVPYMSPEQARGGDTDFHSDQLSFGLILYEMVTGRHAFRRETPPETLEAITNEEATPVSALNPNAPLLLCWIIERCLAKSPVDRYAVTTDLHRDLRMLRDRLNEAMTRQLPPAGAQRRGIMVPRALMVSAVLMAAFGFWIAWRLGGAPQPPDLAGVRFTPFVTDAVYEGFPAWSPDGQTIAYAAEVNGVLQIFTRRVSSPTSGQVTGSPYDSRHPFWSHDGRRLYYISLAGNTEGIWSVSAAGGTPSAVLLNANRGAISPDGTTLAFLRDEERSDVVGASALWLAARDGTNARRYDRAPFGDLRFVEAALWFSPDGRTLAVCGVPRPVGLQAENRGWQFWTLPHPDGQPARRLRGWTGTAPRISSFTWLQDNRHVVLGIMSAGAPDSQLWLADLERDRHWPLTRSADSYYYPSASPAGDQVVFTKGESDYDLMELPLDGRQMQPFVSTARNESDAVWSPRGNSYAYITDRAGQDEIWLRTVDQPPDDRPLITQRDFPDDSTIMLASPSFSPDSQYIAYVRNSSRPIWPLRIWYARVAGGPPVPLLPAAREGYQGSPTWSPDAEWLAFAEWTRTERRLVKVRVLGAEPPVIMRSDGTAGATPQWSPAGDWITWETTDGITIVSAADPTRQKRLSTGHWIVHTWSRDGSRLYAISETDDLRLALISVEIASGTETKLADLGPSPPVNNPLKGLSLSPAGRSLLTSRVRLRGDLWLADGYRLPPSIIDRLWPGRTP